jgi:competence protein ComEA
MADDELPTPTRPLPPPTWRDLVDRVVPPDRAARLRIAGTVVVVVALAAGAWWLLRPPPVPATELSLPRAPAATGAPRSTATTAAPGIVVHAAGAVVSPGVLSLPAGARVADLLTAAGGPAPDADLDRVNLAAPLADGQRVWFPRIGEVAPPPVPGEGGPAPPAGGDGTAGGAPVDLNTATVDQLEALPGIGPTIAAAIVEHRDRSGPFRSVDDLLDVAGIGPSRLEQLRELVTV